MSWASEFPDALRVHPQGLVALSGLDVTYNAVHKVVWDLFCNNRKSDRVPLNFVSLPVDHEYPKAKQKRTNYEWYIPKGILRRDWMAKHLSVVPSLIIMFFDLDWDDPQWNERLMECSTRLQIIRSSMERRSTKIAVVLIQKSPPLPPGEDNLAKERAAALCTDCELSQKSLFVLPHTDHLSGYVVRLENAFYELSQNYYITNIRRVKAHRDYLNRSTHQLLFIRHQFKIAFFFELKQDTQMAMKHYKQAYGHCLETKVHDTNVLEIKVIAGFINYKICSLSFLHNTPLDAIEQFRKHIEYFRTMIGPSNLAFENNAWLSKQFQLFGDLFDDAIKKGLNAVQTQHPGFYYRQSADHGITRRQLCIGICHPGVDVAATQKSIDEMEFFGQRFWRAGQQALEVADQAKEEEGILALQALEMTVSHSAIVINLLNLAIAQFHKFKCSRMQYNLFVKMGEEHYHAKEYTQSLQILNRVAKECRKEKWWFLLTNVLSTAIKCAYLLANVQDYLRLSLELMAEEICRSVETKTRVQVDLLQVVCGNIPDAEPGCEVNAVNIATSRWDEELLRLSNQDVKPVFEYDVSDILSFVECKVVFHQAKCIVEDDIKLTVYVKCKTQFALRFSQLQVLFNDEKYSQSCLLTDGGDLMAVIEDEFINSKDLLFLSNETKSFSFTIRPDTDDMGKHLQVSFVRLSLVSSLNLVLNLPISQQSTQNIEGHTQQLQKERTIGWDSICQQTYIELDCLQSNLEISHNHHESCLLNEMFSIECVLENHENQDLYNIRCSLELDNPEISVVLGMSVESLKNGKKESTSFSIDKLPPGEQVRRSFYLCAKEIGKVNLATKALYNLDNKDAETSELYRQKLNFSIDVIDPFEYTSKYMSMKFGNRESANAGEPFVLEFSVVNKSSCTLYIERSQFNLSAHFQGEGNSSEHQILDMVLDNDEEATEYQCLVTPDAIQNEIVPGEYVLYWRRSDTPGSDLVASMFHLPPLTVEHQPIYVKCSLPASATVNQPFSLVYTVFNKTGYVQEFEASMENSDFFVFSGHKQLHFRTLPYGQHSIWFTLYPLTPGRLSLPQLRLAMLNHTNMSDYIKSLLPDKIYILPRDYDGEGKTI